MHVYFLGICGTAMGNAALLLREAGHRVSGADENVYPPMSDVLANAGIPVEPGYDATRLQRIDPDLVVVGNAQTRGNPEIEWLLNSRAVRFTSLPAVLHEMVLESRKNIVVAGTHGKTTTTAMIAHLLLAENRDPGFLIGGVPRDPPVGYRLGDAKDPFVIEGDEYDSAFFDKRGKFIHYAPHIAVLNNLEFDHADIFRDLADIQRSFSHFIRTVPSEGWILMNGDDPGLAELPPAPWTRVLRVGEGTHCDLRIVDFQESEAGASFSLLWKGRHWTEVRWTQGGIFNARNGAMAALAAGLALWPDDPGRLNPEALATFRGVRRRQEILHAGEKIAVMEDFGHHPTAIGATLRSLRQRYPDWKLTAVFEPRSNTARLKVMQSGFVRALSEADEVFFGVVDRANRAPEGDRFSPAEAADSLRGLGVKATAVSGNADLPKLLRESSSDESRLVVFFSNGSFDGVIGAFTAWAKGEGADR